MPKINLYLLFNTAIVVIFLALFCITAGMRLYDCYHGQVTPGFVAETFDRLWTLFLGIVAWESLKKRAQKAADDYLDKLGQEDK